jgi:two-component system phosphate regulon sensor histidine kinase PhoR
MLVGVIAIQGWWIQHVVSLNEKAFTDAVYKSLGAVVKQVEEKENFVFIQRQVETDTMLRRTKRLLKQHRPRKPMRTQLSTITGSNVQISVNSENGKETRTIVRIEKDNNGHKYVHNSVYVGTAALDSLPMVVFSPSIPPVPPMPPEIETISPLDKKENVEVIMEKMLSLRDPDSVSIKPEEIGHIIAEQLKQNNLSPVFNFALLKKDSSFSFKSADFTGNKNAYQVNLYPNDLFGRSVLLSVNLPDKSTRIRADVWWVFALSLFFTAAILILFIYSIRMLLRHKKLLEMKNDFINHMSHEFKTPLAGISLGADMLIGNTEQMSADQIQRVAGTIKKQSLRLSKEVNDVLQNALLEESIDKPHVLFNVVDTLKGQLELLQPQLENKNARVITSFSSEKILIRGDESQWQKVFSNLIDNSLKFSRENPQINISVAAQGPRVKIELADNGVGIAGKDLPRIFEKFFRSDYYRQSNIQGFGLGLNLVKTVVDAHKGSIKVESELNVGTRMIIELDAEA